MDELEAILYLERGPQPNLRFPLHQLQTTIGRNAGNDLVIVDPEVSRRHAHILRREGQFTVEDLGSTNGTFVNGARVSTETALRDGDTIDLADTVRLRYIITSGPVDEVQPTPAEADQPPATPEPPPAQKPAPQAPARVLVNDPPPRPTSEIVFSAGDSAAFPSGGQAAMPTQPSRGSSRWLLGCVGLFALLLLCIGTFLLLDAYDQGRLLYCGPLRPIFELLLGPFGFAPLC